jgi:integrase
MGRERRQFGRLRKLPSGRWQAAYTGPDTAVYPAPSTFATKLDAEAWLTDRRREIDRESWSPPGAPAASAQTLAEYAAPWLAQRNLKPRTVDHYDQLLHNLILPAFGTATLPSITPAKVRDWHARMGTKTPTLRAHAYALLRTILGCAVVDELLTVNPCTLRGAGSSKRVHKVTPATLGEIAALVEAMPAKYRVLTLLAAWCGLRFGELTELRRKDVDVTNGVLHVRRGVVLVRGEHVVGTPKSAAGIRDVAVPPHLLPALTAHMAEHAQPGRNGLLFPAVNGGHLSSTSLYTVFHPAREAAGRPDLRWHDLRHTGAVLAAATGASLAELMGRLGHSTPDAAMRYQHVAAGRDMAIAKALSALAAGE